jgi:putative membrane protein
MRDMKSMKRKTKKENNNLLLILKGILMGIFDLVPGISGGTIALITNIYQKLMSEIDNFFELIKTIIIVNKKKIKEKYKQTDFKFLIIISLGIAIGIIISINLMSYLLNNYFAQTMGAITGAILASGIIMTKKNYKHKNIIYGAIGLIIGIIISIITPLAGQTFNYTQIFFLGAITIIGMILPGISGALILLLLGGYEFMIFALKNINTEYLVIIAFMAGAIIGLSAFAKTINYALKKHHKKTMIFLSSLMIGATTKPILEIMNSSAPQSAIPFFLITITIALIIARK